MNVIRYEKDDNNIVHMIFDRPNSAANIMDDHFTTSLTTFMEQLRKDSDIAGIIMSSAKKNIFFANLGSRDAVFPGQRTKDVSRPYFLFLTAVDQ